MLTSFIFGSLLLDQDKTQIGKIKRPVNPIVITPQEPTIIVLDEYVFKTNPDNPIASSFSLDTFSSFNDAKVVREATYGNQALAADRKGNVYGVNFAGPSQGAYLYTPSFHSPDDEPKWYGGLHHPMGIACDRAGKIYIVDADLGEVIRVDDRTGKGAVRFGSPGSGIGQFKNPCGIAVGPTGQVYIADTGNNRIVRIDDFNGNGWTTYNGLQYAGQGRQVWFVRDIAVDSKNRLYHCRSDTGCVIRVDDMKGSNMASFGGPASGIGNGHTTISANGIAIDTFDQIFVSDQLGQRIVRIDDFDKQTFRYLRPADNRPFKPSRLVAYVSPTVKLVH